ncbi:MAG: hypothetical protein ACRCX2_34860 [Paraclostridium sp.]
MKVNFVTKKDGRAFVFVTSEEYTLTGTMRPSGFEIREFNTYSAIVEKVKEVTIIDVIADTSLQEILKKLLENKDKISKPEAIETIESLIEGI